VIPAATTTFRSSKNESQAQAAVLAAQRPPAAPANGPLPQPPEADHVSN
jgi:hypothetical protein